MPQSSSPGPVARNVTPYLILLVFVAVLGPFQFGFHLAELNAPQDVITCKQRAIPSLLLARLLAPFSSTTTATDDGYDCIPMSQETFAAISSVFTIGGLIGALAAGPLSSSRGRWLSIQATTILFALGAAIEALARTASLMGTGRLISGLGSGAATVIVPLYISEIAPPAERGFFGAFTQISCNTGILTSQVLGYFLSKGGKWRWILAASGFLAVAQGLLGFAVPESPAWLASARGDVNGAKRVLQRIRGRGADINDEARTWGAGEGSTGGSEEEALLNSSSSDDTLVPTGAGKPSSPGGQHLGFLQVLRDPLTRPAILAVVGIMFTQQLCGINSIVMYSVSLLSGLLPLSSVVITILVSVVNLVMTAACSPLPDKLGRKTCLLISVIGQGTSSLALALGILFGVKILSGVAVGLFVAFFAVGLGPVPFLIATELVGQEAVGATQSWCLAANYTATFLVAQFFPIINKSLNEWLGKAGWVYFLFAGFAALGSLFIAWKVPETNGKRDADEVWGRTRRLD